MRSRYKQVHPQHIGRVLTVCNTTAGSASSPPPPVKRSSSGDCSALYNTVLTSHNPSIFVLIVCCLGKDLVLGCPRPGHRQQPREPCSLACALFCYLNSINPSFLARAGPQTHNRPLELSIEVSKVSPCILQLQDYRNRLQRLYFCRLTVASTARGEPTVVEAFIGSIDGGIAIFRRAILLNTFFDYFLCTVSSSLCLHTLSEQVYLLLPTSSQAQKAATRGSRAIGASAIVVDFRVVCCCGFFDARLRFEFPVTSSGTRYVITMVDGQTTPTDSRGAIGAF